jgi:hypothetical protein
MITPRMRLLAGSHTTRSTCQDAIAGDRLPGALALRYAACS